VLLEHEMLPQYARRSVAAIAAERDQVPTDTICDLILASLEGADRPMVVIHAYSEDDQRRIFAHPMCVPGSDATTLAPDGRLSRQVFHGAYTWAAWYYRFVAREERVLSPEQAIHRLTGMPAAIMGVRDRGVLREGARADIVVFDPERFGEKGTMFEPNQLATGMVHVFVNGQCAFADGALTGTRAGLVLRRT
jgi:N-acyl-D-amino-acid deacylase